MKFGFAETDISPRDGMSTMSGYGRRRYAKGVTSPLLLQAVVIEDAAGHPHALLAADILGFDRSTTERVRRALAAEGFAPERVMLNASHTHFGPPTQYSVTPAAGPVDPWYMSWLEETAVTTVRRARQELCPAEIRYGSFQIKLGENRRLLVDGKIQMRPNPAGHYDQHTVCLWATPVAKDSPETVILAHGCHPVSCAAEGYSADFPGEFRRCMTSQRAGTHVMFLQGCGADVNEAPGDGYVRHGGQLARAVTELLAPQRMQVLDGTVSAAIERAELPLGKRHSRQRLEEWAWGLSSSVFHSHFAREHLRVPDPRKAIPYTVQAWRCGELAVVALEGEVVSAYGPLARSLAGGECMVLGYSNAVECYIPTAQIQREGGYEAVDSAFAYGLPAPLARSAPAVVTRTIRATLARTQAGTVHRNR
ncbi:MAG: hypothetical protein A3K19_24430 [Lentisphaerae bacterium RIFOXYB12_FULL_65_16]|nr:MAG: hypothetical protein A3K18_05515 [Lentisphaerae bacterium RIFOXYA12_64_32]OGV90598.1 MAG: hypothetical protein A3K19_24430 [Lentisphaerae bacterium RIFOXYB12_FULL_65_16]